MKILAVLPVFNEEDKIGKVLTKFKPNSVDEILVVNDGSTDNTLQVIKKFDVTVINHRTKMGVGAGIKDGVDYAIKNDYGVVVIMAGNGKDDPTEIPRLVSPIIHEHYDYIQGSRFLKGGKQENTPLLRIIAIKIYSFLWSRLMGISITDITNGFRAYKTNLFLDKRINIWQDWLGTYELEYYLHYKVIKLGYKMKEVPVSKIYLANEKYTKIRPFLDWWRIIKPLFYLTFKIKE